jgi:hypothetical protein
LEALTKQDADLAQALIDNLPSLTAPYSKYCAGLKTAQVACLYFYLYYLSTLVNV